MVIKTLLALMITIAAALPTRAQGPLGPWDDATNMQTVRDAIESPYAAARLAIFVESVRRHADPACLQAKALDDAALAARGRALWQRYALQSFRLLGESFDRAAYFAALTATAGPDAAGELEQLRGNPDVQKLIALDRPAQLAQILDLVTEQFDRYLMIARIKLDPVSPAARGEPDSKDNPTKAAHAAVQQFVDDNPSPQVDRYLDLVEAAETAIQTAMRSATAPKLGPAAFFAGADRDLAELCVGRR